MLADLEFWVAGMEAPCSSLLEYQSGVPWFICITLLLPQCKEGV